MQPVPRLLNVVLKHGKLLQGGRGRLARATDTPQGDSQNGGFPLKPAYNWPFKPQRRTRGRLPPGFQNLAARAAVPSACRKARRVSTLHPGGIFKIPKLGAQSTKSNEVKT